MDTEHLAYARKLDSQHPDRWTPGQWYPATNPDGSTVEIKRTNGRGRNRGSFLHIRKQVPLYIVDKGTDKRTRFGNTYHHGRVNLATGAFAWVD